VAGTSLEAIAAEAGMRRSILRHFVGNRDQLLIETARLATSRIEAAMDDWVRAILAGSGPVEDGEAVDWWMTIEALVEGVERPVEARDLAKRCRQRMLDALVSALGTGSLSDRAQRAAVAAGLLALRRQAAIRRRLGESASEEATAAGLLLDSLPGGSIRADRAAPPEPPLSEDTEIGLND